MGKQKHIVIDARIRSASTGRPIARMLEYMQDLESPHRYTILLKEDDDWQPTNDRLSVKHIPYPIFSFNPFHQLRFAAYLYRLRADLVHFTLTPSQPLLYFRPFTTFTHDLAMFRFARAGTLPGWLHAVRMLGYRLLVWHAHRFAKAITVPTEFTKTDVMKHYPHTKDKLHVTLEASEPPLPEAAVPPAHRPEEFIMYTGNMFPHKNVEGLIDAFNLLKKEHPKLQLVLVGKIEQHAKTVQSYAQTLSCKDDIIFANDQGFVEDLTLKWYLEHARTYVFPTFFEGFGLTGLEAMAHGCPVISSNATTLPEVHGDAALYFDPHNAQEMADQIHAVLSNKKLRDDLIKKGHQNIKRFSWHTFTKETMGLLERILL